MQSMKLLYDMGKFRKTPPITKATIELNVDTSIKQSLSTYVNKNNIMHACVAYL